VNLIGLYAKGAAQAALFCVIPRFQVAVQAFFRFLPLLSAGHWDLPIVGHELAITGWRSILIFYSYSFSA
jgi:hypothetical protein